MPESGDKVVVGCGRKICTVWSPGVSLWARDIRMYDHIAGWTARGSDTVGGRIAPEWQKKMGNLHIYDITFIPLTPARWELGPVRGPGLESPG